MRAAAVVAATAGVGLALAAAGCDLFGSDDFVELGGFRELAPLETLDPGGVEPATATELWELRCSSFGSNHEVLLEGGTTGRAGLDPETLVAFDALASEFGFGLLCLPGDCFYYFASVQGGLLRTWRTRDEVREFLGRIDTQEEAALAVLSDGYRWTEGKETGAIRETDAGFELVVIRMVEFCDPVRTDRFLVVVTRAGEVSARRSEVWKSQDGVCI